MSFDSWPQIVNCLASTILLRLISDISNTTFFTFISFRDSLIPF